MRCWTQNPRERRCGISIEVSLSPYKREKAPEVEVRKAGQTGGRKRERDEIARP